MSTHHEHTKDTTVLGFWLYIMSDCLLFATLFATFAVLRNNTAGGADAAELFSLPFVLVETLILLTSSFTCGLALLAMYRKKSTQTLWWLAATGLLGATFVSLELYEFSNLVLEGHSWQASAFLSSFFTLVGTHGLHVTIGIIWMLTLAVLLYLRGITKSLEWRIMCFVLFWHFLDIVWIFIFSFVYLIPLIL